jgi:hypothetical protein
MRQKAVRILRTTTAVEANIGVAAVAFYGISNSRAACRLEVAILSTTVVPVGFVDVVVIITLKHAWVSESCRVDWRTFAVAG